MAITLSQFVTGTVSNLSSLNVLFSSVVTGGNSLNVVTTVFSAGAGLFSTVVDSVNTAGYTARVFSTMSNASDTQAHLLIHDKLNISSGRAASTYRISVNMTASALASVCASEWTGGPHTFGSTISANGTSSGPVAGNLTASSTPALFLSAAMHNSTSVFASTATGGALYMTTVDPTNANAIANVVYDLINSSLQKNIGHSLTSSTRWLAASVVYMGLGSGGGGAALVNPWTLTLTGIQ